MQTNAATEAVGIHDFGQCVGQATRADIVNRQDRVDLAQCPAGVDDFLTAPLQFRIGTLHRSEIQLDGAAAGGHARRRATAETDQHRRPAQHDELCARRHRLFMHVAVADVAVAAGQHHRLVIAADRTVVEPSLKAAEITRQHRAPELIAVGSGADRRFQHDLQGAGHLRWPAQRLFPRLFKTGNMQIGHRKPAQSSLGLAAAPGGGLVADLAAGAGSGTRMGRDAGGVVVRLHFHQQVHRLDVLAPDAVGIGKPASSLGAGHHCGVVLVG